MTALTPDDLARIEELAVSQRKRAAAFNDAGLRFGVADLLNAGADANTALVAAVRSRDERITELETELVAATRRHSRALEVAEGNAHRITELEAHCIIECARCGTRMICQDENGNDENTQMEVCSRCCFQIHDGLTRAAEATAAEAEAVVVALMEATSVLDSTDAEMIQWIGTAFESTRSQEVLARVKAEAWDEGRQSIGNDLVKPADRNGMRTPSLNPYRAGADR